MSMRNCLAILALLLSLGACNRDPETVKKRYLDTGNKYLAQGKLKEASIMYRNALKKDAKYGEAYWKLGEVELRRGDVGEASRALRRAIELLPNNPEPASKLAEIYLAAYSAQREKDKRLLDETREIADTMLKRDPKSYYGLRLKGFLATVNADYANAVTLLRAADEAKPNQPELQLALAQVLAATQKLEESEQIVKKLIAEKKDYAAAYDYLFLLYARTNRPADAEAVLRQRIEAFPKVVAYRLQQAGYFYSTKRQPEGEKVIADIVANPTDFPDGNLAAGDFYMRTREWGKALKFYEDGASKNPKNKDAYRIKMVLAKAAANRLDEALALADQIVKDDPKNNDALQLRASLVLQSGAVKGNEQRVQGAINDLQALLGKTPNNPALRYNLARAYQGRGELDAARVQYQEAVKLRPDFIAAQVGLGQVLLAKNEDARALQTAEEVLRLDPNNLAGKIIRTGALMKTGNIKQARTDLEAALKTTPDQPDLMYQMAIIDVREKRFKEAQDSFAKLRQRFPGDARLLFAMSEINLLTGQPEAAIRLLDEELQKNPDRQDVRMALASAALRTNNVDRAVTELKSLVEKNPKDFTLYMRLSDALRRKGDAQGAMQAIRTGQSLAPTNPTANLQMALTLEFFGQKTEAKPFYESVLKTEPDNAIALNNLAYMMAEDGKDLDQALTYAQRAKQKIPNSDDVADTLGWIYIKKNLSDNAISIFKDLVVKQPKNSTFHYHLGMALYQKGDKPKAKQSLQTALAQKPGKDEEAKIKELLAKVG